MSKRYFFEDELKAMSEHPGKRAMEIGRREPYYLTYLKKGLPNPKPKPREVENDRKQP